MANFADVIQTAQETRERVYENYQKADRMSQAIHHRMASEIVTAGGALEHVRRDQLEDFTGGIAWREYRLTIPPTQRGTASQTRLRFGVGYVETDGDYVLALPGRGYFNFNEESMEEAVSKIYGFMVDGLEEEATARIGE